MAIAPLGAVSSYKPTAPVNAADAANSSMVQTTQEQRSEAADQQRTEDARTYLTDATKAMVDLKQFASTSPELVRQTFSTITTRLREEASKAGKDQRQVLYQLADQFQAAAQTGDMSAIDVSRTSSARAEYDSRGQRNQLEAYNRSDVKDTVGVVIQRALAQVSAATASASASLVQAKIDDATPRGTPPVTRISTQA